MFDRFKNFINTWLGTESSFWGARWPQLTGKKFDISQSLNISTVYTCINILASTISRIPVDVLQFTEGKGKQKDKKDPLYSLLKYNPNDYTTSNSFFAYLETCRNYKGNSFARINRENGEVTSFEIIPYRWVKGYGIEGGQLYYFIEPTKGGKMDVLNSHDILHFKSLVTLDGIWGLNPIEALRVNLSATAKGLAAIDTFYDNNANSSKVIRSTVAGANQGKMLEALVKFQKDYAGTENSGKMIPLPPNTEIQELKLSVADAQFIETARFSAEQIAAVYQVPPDRAGILTASKFNSVEHSGLNFKVNTIASIVRMYRQELEFKTLSTEQRLNGKSIEHNTNAMIELDTKTKMESYKILSNIAAISPNTVSLLESLPTDPSGDVRLAPMNMMPLEKFKIKDNEKFGN